MGSQTIEQTLISKTNVIYTTDAPQNTQDEVNYLWRSESFSKKDIVDIARDKEKECVLIVNTPELEVKPAMWTLKETDVVVGMAFIAKGDIIAANKRKAISPIMRKHAVRVMTEVIKNSYQ